MPHLRIETNVPRSKIPDDFLKLTCSLLAKILAKPESYCAVTIIPDTMMVWGGSDAPCACARLLSLGQLGDTQNVKHAKVLYDHIEKSLGVPPDRMYMQFVDEKPANLGYNGTTFKDIFG